MQIRVQACAAVATALNGSDALIANRTSFPQNSFSSLSILPHPLQLTKYHRPWATSITMDPPFKRMVMPERLRQTLSLLPDDYIANPPTTPGALDKATGQLYNASLQYGSSFCDIELAYQYLCQYVQYPANTFMANLCEEKYRIFRVLNLMPGNYLVNPPTTSKALANAIGELEVAIAEHGISNDDATLAVEYLVNPYISGQSNQSAASSACKVFSGAAMSSGATINDHHCDGGLGDVHVEKHY